MYSDCMCKSRLVDCKKFLLVVAVSQFNGIDATIGILSGASKRIAEAENDGEHSETLA